VTDGSGPGIPVMDPGLVAPSAATAEATTHALDASGFRPAVRFGDGRRPETTTHVEVAEFQGPLGLLLSLIEARKLDVLTVPLGGLADAYLDALASLEDDRLGNISAFVAVASQLILIKSRAMLPRPPVVDEHGSTDEGPDPEEELRRRLLLYRAYRDAGVALQATAQERIGLFRREPAAARAAGRAGARPADGPVLDPTRLQRALAHLATIAPTPAPPPEVMPRTITLTERASIIRAALGAAPSIVLQDLLTGVRDRVVIAVTFLAMLELMKRREIVVEQAQPWGPIVARRTTAEERLAAGLSAEMPTDEDLDESMEGFA
jgi:segregation and condensation protein A